MKLKVIRLKDNGDTTIGALYIDGKFECWTLEDEHRTVKVFGETRIPEGEYEIKLRTVGGHHNRYKNKFGFHKGMLHLQDVPNFKWILIHIGNTDDDTAGCLLVGQSVSEHSIGNSTLAYKKMYEKVLEAFLIGEKVYITYFDAED